jgi:hypothetical protein
MPTNLPEGNHSAPFVGTCAYGQGKVDSALICSYFLGILFRCPSADCQSLLPRLRRRPPLNHRHDRADGSQAHTLAVSGQEEEREQEG